MNANPTQKLLKKLEEQLYHKFSDRTLLVEALTHASFVEEVAPQQAGKDYQRLEFLGDRVLGLLASEALMARYPHSDEGGLAVRLNALVRKETCAEIGGALDLGTYFFLGGAEDHAGLRRSTALLSDICESILGALYLDGGLEAARKVFLAQWEGYIDQLDVVRRDPKTALQEWAQGSGFDKPRYREVSRSGPDHAPSFRIEVSVGSLAPVEEEGPNKRAAEKKAAKIILIREGIWPSPDQNNK